MKRSGIPALALAAIAILASPGAPAQDASENAEKLAGTRDTLAKWVETQQIISREREDWQVGKDVLEQRIALIRGEIDGLEGRIAEIDGGLGDTDRRRRELDAENAALREASASLAAGIGGLEAKTLRLIGRLPEPIRSRVKPLSQRIPTDPGSTEPSLSQRFQNVVGVLNEVNKFQRDITVTSELRSLEDGRTVEVTALYVGLGQGYYVTPDGAAAGYGGPGPEGWEWFPANELAAQVAHAIAILQNEQVPAFVPLPVEIR